MSKVQEENGQELQEAEMHGKFWRKPNSNGRIRDEEEKNGASIEINDF